MSNQTLWWKEAIIYELYVDKFAGDFSSLTGKLDYLKSLGVNCVHVLPHYPSPGVDDGYDVSDYTAVRKELGTLDDFKTFVTEAHEKGIRVIVDLVLNHASIKHAWFEEARSSTDNPKRNYFLWSKNGEGYKDSLNIFYHSKPSNWVYNDQNDDYYFSTFYSEQADLNWDNPEVVEEFTRIMDFWVDKGVDGFRLDALSHLVKREGTTCQHLPETHMLLKNLRRHIDKYAPNVIFLGEVDGPVETTKKYFGDSDECHMVYLFPFSCNALFSFISDDFHRLDELIHQAVDIPKSCEWATFLRNHDDFSVRTLSPEDRKKLFDYCDPERKYAFGNDLAMRLAKMLREDSDDILTIFRILLETPGAPVIYYGDEIGLVNQELDSPVKDSRKYVRNHFDWNLAEKQRRNPASLLNAVSCLAEERAEWNMQHNVPESARTLSNKCKIVIDNMPENPVPAFQFIPIDDKNS